MATENGMAGPQKVKHRIMLSSNPNSGYIHKRTESRNLSNYTFVLIAASVTIVKRGKQPKHLLTDE